MVLFKRLLVTFADCCCCCCCFRRRCRRRYHRRRHTANSLTCMCRPRCSFFTVCKTDTFAVRYSQQFTAPNTIQFNTIVSVYLNDDMVFLHEDDIFTRSIYVDPVQIETKSFVRTTDFMSFNNFICFLY